MIVGIRRALRTLWKYCFICRRWRADNVRPKMAPLPKFRFPEHSKLYPFVNTGMDVFGPFHIEKSRTQTELNYVCMFTCLVTRAVHLEVCKDLSTDCLLMAIQRFVSRRGYPDVIVSDNGKNFVGANQAMKINFQKNYKPDNNYIRLQLAQQNDQWTFNPPLAPHFGGVWERLIQSAKRSLHVVLGSRRLNFSVFHTVVAEAEGILNSRPLTHVGSTLTAEEPLTPNHFLTRRRHFCLKPLAKDNKFNPSAAPHFGGVWERLVRSCKKALYAVLGNRLVTEEVLSTTMCVVEQTLNARPLTPVSSDVNDLEALTSNHFLLGNKNVCLPYLPCAEEFVNHRKFFRQTQAHANLIWDRFRKEYLPTLKNRQKWRSTTNETLTELDLVWLIEDSDKRGYYNLGRVTGTNDESDGVIRSAIVRTNDGVYKSPVVKLAPVLPGKDGFAMENRAGDIAAELTNSVTKLNSASRPFQALNPE